MAPAEEKFTQDGRVLRLSVTGLEKDFLLIDSIDATEAVSNPFKYDIKARHAEKSETGPPTVVKPSDILGKVVTVEVVQPDGTKRFFHGMANRFVQGGRDPKFTSYRMEVVPHFWLLTQSHQSRIFQQMTVKDILVKVLQGLDIKFELQRTYQPRNYCVQYRESDFDFASRLMEEEGIFYYFEHTADHHTMIIADDPESFRASKSKSSIDFVDENTRKLETPLVYEWALNYQLQTARIEFWDYHFQLQPFKKLEVSEQSRFNDVGNKDAEFYDYPGGYAKKRDGINKGGGEDPADLQKVFEDNKQTAKNAKDALDAKFKTYRGLSDCASFTAGQRIKIDNLPIKDDNREYALTSVSLHCDQSPDYTSIHDKIDSPIVNQFECIPLGDSTFPPFRPQQVTPKPTVYGPMTAVVVGPSGDEIFTDKYGRVKVQFLWDREGKNDPGSSCWLRVTTSIAGNKWGTMFIPRVGQEVLVAFEHGDPDQPIIIGSVYNEKSLPHYELPKFETLSYIKTRTSPDDGKGFNELRFEDKKDKEQVFVHSQKRYDLRVRGSMYETCGGNRQEVIGMRSDNKPGGNLAISVGGNFDLHVKEAQYIGIDKKLNESVKEDVVESYQQSQQTFVTNKIELNAKEITIEGSSKVQLKVGSSCVILDLSGVTIKGPMVKINPMVAMVPPTGPAIVDAPLDAESADTGEPGYLDRPRRGGGGGGRRRTTLTGQHAPIVTDQAFALTRAMGTADDLDRALVAAELSRMPPHILTRMQNNGTTVAVCRNSVTEVRQDLRGVQPRSWPAGTTWDTVPGLNDPNTNQVIIATRGHGTPEGAHVPRSGDGHGSSNLVIHESMHSVDGHGPGGNHISATDQNFNNARNADPAIMGDSYEGTANPAGAEEAYAESAARYYGGDPNDAANHPGVNNYWAGDPLNPNPPAPAPAPAGP